MKTLTLNDYIITEQGEIINKRNGRKLRPQPNGKGYLRVFICQKKLFVHRLVAEKYIPNPENKPQVNHKDGNRLNNSVDNLEWVTNQENRDHAVKNRLHLCGEDCPWSKLNWEKVDFIRTHNEYTAKQLAEMYNVTVPTVREVRQGKSWKVVEKIC